MVGAIVPFATGIGKGYRLARKSVKFRKFTRGNFRTNLYRLTGKIPKGAEAHHIFPHKYIDEFADIGIDVNKPKEPRIN